MKMNTSKLAIVALIFASSTLCGCYNAEEVQSFLLKPRAPVSAGRYIVYPPDVLQIASRQVQEIAEVTQQVRPDGKINLPLVGEIYVAGRTPKQIEQAIAEKAQEYYEQVDVTVTVAGFLSQKFYIFGQVNAPGARQWTGRDTVLDALAVAQLNVFAWAERITVVRGNSPQVGGFETPDTPDSDYSSSGVHPKDPNRPTHKILFNLKAMINSGDMANNILLQPGDIIHVHPHPLAAVGLALQSLLMPIRPATETVTTPVAAAAAF